MASRPAEQDIRERAYALWEARGRADGDPLADWLAAEKQLTAELAAMSSPLPSVATSAADMLLDEAEATHHGLPGQPGARPRTH